MKKNQLGILGMNNISAKVMNLIGRLKSRRTNGLGIRLRVLEERKKRPMRWRDKEGQT